MANKDFLSKYRKDNKNIKGLQEGGAPAPAGGAPAPEGGGAVNPEEMINAYIQASQAGDEQAQCAIAMEFMEFVIAQMQSQQGPESVPARRMGGNFKFDKNGKIL